MNKILEMFLDDEKSDIDGVYALSIVNNPAMKSNHVLLAEEKLQLKVQDEKKKILTGAALIPDKLITRFDKKTKEPYQIYFSEETIEKTSQKFLQNFNQSNITVEHMLSVDDVTVVESWIKEDETMDKSNALGLDVPVGTWMMTLKVENDELWDGLLETGLLNGLSIEGNFLSKEVEKTGLSVLSTELNKNDKMNKKEKNIITAIRDAFMGKPENVEAAEVAEVSKWWTEVTNETFELNTQIMRKPYEEGGDENPLSAGEYELEDGRKILVDSEGIIRYFFDAVEEEVEEVEEVVEEEVTEEVAEEETVEASEETQETVEEVVEAPETVAEVAEAIVEKEVEEVPIIPHTDTQSRKRVKIKFDSKLTVQERIKQNLESNLN